MSKYLAHFPKIILTLLIIGYVAFFSAQLLRHYHTFGSRALDLGNMDQTLWNTLHGRPFHQTNQPGATSRLSLHVEPIFLPLSLLYLIYSGPEILFFFQSLVVALGAVPVYALARYKLKSESLALVFAAIFLLFPAIQGATLLDFHAVTLAPTFLLAAFYFMETRRTGLFALFALLTVACKEDMTLLVLMLGLYAFFVNRQYRLGGLTVALCGLWAFVAVFVIPPQFAGTGNIHWNRYEHLGDSPLDIVFNLFREPDRFITHLREVNALAYLRLLLTPTAFTALLNPPTLLLALPSLGINLLSNFPPMQRVNSLIYAAPLVPAVIISSIYGVANLQRAVAWLARRRAEKQRRRGAGEQPFQEASRSSGGAEAQPFQEAPHGSGSAEAQRNTQYAIRNTQYAPRTSAKPPPGTHRVSRFCHPERNEVERRIPMGVVSPQPSKGFFTTLRSVQNDRFSVFHLPISHSLTLLLLAAALIYHSRYGYLPGGGQYRGWPEITPHHRLAERIFAQIPPEAALSAQDRLNPHVSQRETLYIFDRIDDADYIVLDVTEDSWPLHPIQLRDRVLELLRGDFGLVEAIDGYLLLAKRPDLPRDLPDAFYDFARAPEPARFSPVYPARVVFDEKIELLGYDLSLGAHEAALPVVTLYWRALEPLDQAYTLWPFFIDRQGRLLEDPGQRPLVTTLWYPTSAWAADEIILTRTLPYDLGDEFTLAAGVAQADWSNPAQRLPISQVAEDLYTFENDSWVRLGTFRQTGRGRYEPVEPAAPPPASTQVAQFWELINLLQADLPAGPLNPAQALPFTLTWQTTGPVPVDLTAFVHLVDPAGNVVAQLDWQTQDALGYLPTSAWQPGRPVVDHQTLPLPADLPAGTYRLLAGWYYAPTGDRLPLTAGGVGEVVTLGEVVIGE